MNTHHHNPDLPGATWRKASYSNGNGGDCVEVASLTGGHRAVRDSKNPAGPVLTVAAAGWGEFTAGVRAGEFG